MTQPISPMLARSITTKRFRALLDAVMKSLILILLLMLMPISEAHAQACDFHKVDGECCVFNNPVCGKECGFTCFMPQPSFPPPSVFGAGYPSGYSSEPVNTAIGNYVYQYTDLAASGRGLRFIFAQSYNSLDSYSGPLGPGWTHSYNIFISTNPDNSVTVKRGDGKEDIFDPSGGGNYTPRFGGVFDILMQNFDGSFTLISKNQTHYDFNAGGKLVSITEKNGNKLSFAYDANQNLTTITDTVGRAFTLNYNSNHQITGVTDPNQAHGTLHAHGTLQL
jgi:YD repeat-containing protein